jgi:hypothetical protein
MPAKKSLSLTHSYAVASIPEASKASVVSGYNVPYSYLKLNVYKI